MEQEILVEGKNFKLASISELPEIVDFLANYLPDSVKVRGLKWFTCLVVW